MKDEMLMSQSLFSRSSKMKRLRLISVTAVLLAVCLAFVGAAGADAVAKIERTGVSYESIQAAVEAAENGDVIKVTASHNLLGRSDVQTPPDTTDYVWILVENKDITIDLNGKTVTADYSNGNWDTYTDSITAIIWVHTGAKLTLTDSSEDKTGTLKVIATEANQNEGNYKVQYMLYNYNNGDNAWDEGYSLIIEGGNYVFDFGVHDESSCIVYSLKGDRTRVTDGTFEMTNTGSHQKAYTKCPWIFNVKGNNQNGGIIVTGGTFNADVNHQFRKFEVDILETLAVSKIGDNTWTVVPAVAYVREYFGEWGCNVGYATVEEAVTAANNCGCTAEKTHSDKGLPSGQTVEKREVITLLQDAVLKDTLEFTKSTVFNINDDCAITWEGDFNAPIFKVTGEDNSLTIDEFTPIREGHTFEGWYTDLGFTNELTADGVLTVEGDTSLYAKWTTNSYTIKVTQPMGGEVVASKDGAYFREEIELTQTPSTGYEFKGWEVTTDKRVTVEVADNIFSMPADNVTVSATFVPLQYNVFFDANGGTPTPDTLLVTYDSQYANLPNAEREGYTFLYWKHADGTEITNETVVKTAKDHTLTAVWEKIEITTPPTSSGGSGISGYESHSRTTKNGGSVDFGASKVIKGVILPEGSSGSVVLKVDTIEGWTNILETEYTFDISVEKLGEGMAYILFEIPLRTLENLGITPADVCAYHFIDGEWVMLKTNYEVKERTVFYEAETDSFSPFKLVFEEGAATPKEAETKPVIPPTEEPENKPEDIAPPLDEPVQPTEPETPAPILAVLAGLGAAVLLRRK